MRVATAIHLLVTRDVGDQASHVKHVEMRNVASNPHYLIEHGRRAARPKPQGKPERIDVLLHRSRGEDVRNSEAREDISTRCQNLAVGVESGWIEAKATEKLVDCRL